MIKAPTLPFLRATFPDDLHMQLAPVLASGHVGAGPRVDDFENAVRHFLSAPSLTITSSGTAALTLAYVAAGIREGSVVLATPMTCLATNIPLLQLGAKVYWLDINPRSGNVTARAVEAGLKRHPDTCAVVVMDWGGTPCEYLAIADECRHTNATLVLDAAQSFGATLDKRNYPSGPDYVCYSFGPTKILSAIEGGAIGVNNPVAATELQRLRWYGIERHRRDLWRFWDYEVAELGYRATSNDLLATVGLVMLGRLGDRLRLHRDLAAVYDQELQHIHGLSIAERPASSSPNFWLYTVLVERRSELITKLHREGFHAATPHHRNDRQLERWCPTSGDEDLPGVDAFDARYLCLPIGPWVRPVDVEKICATIRNGW